MIKNDRFGKNLPKHGEYFLVFAGKALWLDFLFIYLFLFFFPPKKIVMVLKQLLALLWRSCKLWQPLELTP